MAREALDPMKMKPISDEFRALCELAQGRVRTRISAQMGDRLVGLGFAREAADGIAITRRGRDVVTALEQATRPR